MEILLILSLAIMVEQIPVEAEYLSGFTGKHFMGLFGGGGSISEGGGMSKILIQDPNDRNFGENVNVKSSCTKLLIKLREIVGLTIWHISNLV